MTPLTALLHMSLRRGLQIGMAAVLVSVPFGFLHIPSSYAATSPESAQEEPKPGGTDTEWVKQYEYQMEDREDPFVPFLTEKATTSTVDMNEIVESNEKLTGMQLFEPGQLTLVALLATNGRAVAMVEDVTGKGYMIEEGTKIGRRGVVKDIIPNKVVIEETAYTRAGKKIVTQIVMVLKKEGEE